MVDKDYINTLDVAGAADDLDIYQNDHHLATYEWTDDDAYALIFINGKVEIGHAGEKHYSLAARLLGCFEDDSPDEMYNLDPNYIEARLWVKPHDRFPYPLLYFWGKGNNTNISSYKSELSKIIQQMGINPDNLVIGYERPDNDWAGMLESYTEWVGNVPEIGPRQLKRKQLHNLPPEEKTRGHRGF